MEGGIHEIPLQSICRGLNIQSNLWEIIVESRNPNNWDSGGCRHYTYTNWKKLSSPGDFETSPPLQLIKIVIIIMSINNVYNTVSARHTRDYIHDLYLLSLPPPIGFLQRDHHKLILQQIQVSFSQKVICLSLNFSCDLLFIGPLIYLPQFHWRFTILGRPMDFLDIFITALYISIVIRPCTFPYQWTFKKASHFQVSLWTDVLPWQ